MPPKIAVEDEYKRLDQKEHVLLRPDTYVGSTQMSEPKLMWVFDSETKKMVQKNISFIPALYKIFDEILVNAADNKQRDPPMKKMDIKIDAETGTIVVWNDGKPIPVVRHQKENCYVPELIFGKLLTSSNYDDQVDKVVGGRNGYGAKLTNIFSSKFVVECYDNVNGKKFKQVFQNNMNNIGSPDLKDCKEKGSGWTRISFKPDMKQFQMEDNRLDDDIISLMIKRVYDMAGIMGDKVNVVLNGEKLQVRNFQDYVKLHLPEDQVGSAAVVYEKVNPNWEVCVIPSEGHFAQVSFVNGISTPDGGTHVEYIYKQLEKGICDKIISKLPKKSKTSAVKPYMIRSNVWLFINSLIVNPSFDGQIKEKLNLPASKFKNECQLSSKFIDKVNSSGILQAIQDLMQSKENSLIKRTDGNKTANVIGIDKLRDAPKAGTKDSLKCTLVLTEGDSAKGLAIAGFEVVDKTLFGAYPLKGKLLNVREASKKQFAENKEIQDLKKILGLKSNQEHTDVKSLRYGRVMIMTDQDADGFHIKGLLCNFFHMYYRSLLQQGQFLYEFITPLVKASKGNQKLAFYNMGEYQAWKDRQGAGIKGWNVKYYKGLGTSDHKEARDYFREIHKNRKEYTWQNDAQEDDCFSLAFAKEKANQRKDWLMNYAGESAVRDYSEPSISYNQFVHTELVQYSKMNVDRSIPSMIDGFKPVQRKVFFGCVKRNVVKEVKVVQLGGMIAKDSSYHHGDVSLLNTIINMAQNFPGTNNINLLDPIGQFGSRLAGGKDASAPRYINTKLMPISRLIFRKEDDAILKYQNEEGQTIEPYFYLPIIPIVLVNGAEGIGTGWSTFVPQFKPEEIVENCKRVLKNIVQGEGAGGELLEMIPHYYKYHGIIEPQPNKPGQFVTAGIFEWLDESSIHITELPVKYWTNDFKKHLNSMGSKEVNIVVGIEDLNGLTTVDTTVHFNPDKVESTVRGKEFEVLKLRSTLNTTNMMLFDETGRIKKYSSAKEIIQEFVEFRYKQYTVRKNYMIQLLEAKLQRKDNQVRFIIAVVEEQLILRKRAKLAIEADMEEMGLLRLPAKISIESFYMDEKDTEEQAAAIEGSYEYLLGMSLQSQTLENVRKIKQEMEQMKKELADLKATSTETMYLRDLDELSDALVKLEEQRNAEEAEERNEKQKNKGIVQDGLKKKRVQKSKKGANTEKATNGEKEISATDKNSEETGGVSNGGVKKARAKQTKTTKKPVVPDVSTLRPLTEQTEVVKGSTSNATAASSQLPQQASITQFFQKPAAKQGGANKGKGQKRARKQQEDILDLLDSDADDESDSVDENVEGPSRPKRITRETNKKQKVDKVINSMDTSEAEEEDDNESVEDLLDDMESEDEDDVYAPSD